MVSFIFDDGWLDIYTDAYPVFQKHNKSATIAVISNYVDTKGGLSTRHIRKLINAGWDVAAHSINDASMLTLSRTEQYQALLLSKDVLWKRFWATQNFIFPYGHYDQLLMKMAQQQYKSARGYEPGINTFPVDPFNLKVISLEHDTKDSQIISAIDQVAQQKGWLIFVGHHVSDQDTSEYSLGAEKYDYALEYIATKDLQVLTYDQAIQTLVPHAALIQEGQLRFEIDPRLVHPLDIFYVVIDGKRTKLIQVPTQI